MIRLVNQGDYSLIETRAHVKILTLKGLGVYAWIPVRGLGELLVVSHNPHRTDYVLSKGKYRLYEVQGEAEFVDLSHLELMVGPGSWQGYLLTSGLPNELQKRKRIVPTAEVITAPTLRAGFHPPAPV